MVWFSTLSQVADWLADRSNGAELSGWCFTIFSNRFQLWSRRQRLRSLSATSGNSLLFEIGSLVVLVPLPWRLLLHVLSLACAAYLYSWSTTFLVAAAASFSSVCRVRLDDVCGFSTKSRRGQWALLPPLCSSLATTAGCSTKWNSFAILGRAHVHTHLLAFSTSSSSRLWITRTEKKSLSGIKLELVAAGTHDDAHQRENYSTTHGKLTSFFSEINLLALLL